MNNLYTRFNDVKEFIERSASERELQKLQDLAQAKLQELRRRETSVSVFDFPVIKVKEDKGIYATIYQKPQSITIEIPNDVDIYGILSTYGYSKKRDYYIKYMGPFSGDIEDRVSEIGHLLLSKNINVRFEVDNFERVKQKIENESFTEDVKQIIGYSEDEEVFKIAWYGYRSYIYSKARSIRGSKWNSIERSVEVPYTQYLEIEDFAEEFDCFFTDKAKQAIKLLKSTPELDIKVDKKDVKKMIDIPEDLLDD